MEVSCCMNNCSQPATLACGCKGIFIFFCEPHYDSHTIEETKGQHFKTSLERNIRNQDKSKIIKHLEDYVANENFIKFQIIKMIQKLSKEAEQIIQHSMKACSQLKKMIKDIKSKNSVILPFPKKSFASHSFLELEELEVIKNLCSSYKKLKWEFFKIDKNLVLREWETLTECKSPSKADNKEKTLNSLNPQESLHIFGGSNELISLNLTDLTEKRFKVNFSEKLEKYCCLQLNNDQLFILGGRYSYKNPINYSTFILDLKTKDHQEYSKGLPAQDVIPAMLNDKVFIFGGCSSKGYSAKSQVFNLTLKTWKEISDMPKPTSKTSTVSVKSRILITNCLNNCFYLYHEQHDTYETIKIDSKLTDKNILIKSNQSIFTISSKIYECSQSKINKWKMVSETGINQGWIITAGVIRGNFAYFADCEYSIFKFNLKNKRIEVVTKIIL